MWQPHAWFAGCGNVLANMHAYRQQLFSCTFKRPTCVQQNQKECNPSLRKKHKILDEEHIMSKQNARQLTLSPDHENIWLLKKIIKRSENMYIDYATNAFIL